MKVGNKMGQNLAGVESAKANKTEAGKKSDVKQSSVFDKAQLGDTAKVNLSDRAQAMQKAKDIAGNQTVDEAKVARLQKLIDEGKYKVDAEAVADRLVNEHLAMTE